MCFVLFYTEQTEDNNIGKYIKRRFRNEWQVKAFVHDLKERLLGRARGGDKTNGAETRKIRTTEFEVLAKYRVPQNVLIITHEVCP